MTDDDLRRAVAILRGLQEDVERLKAERGEGGEVRFLRQIEDGTATDDSFSVSTTQASPGKWGSDNWDSSLEWG